MEIISKIAMITINETLFAQIGSFLIFLFLINRIMFKPLRQTMDERDGYLHTMQGEMVQMEKELNELTDQMKAEETAVRSEAIRLSQELETTGAHQANDIFTVAKESVESQIADAKVAIDDQIAEASRSIRDESESLAIRIIENLLDRKIVQ